MPTAHRTRIDSLDCIVVDGGPDPSIPVVICHGYGASYEDLAPLSSEWIGLLEDLAGTFRFVFPDAPNSLAELGMPDGKAWWPINMSRLAELVQASRFDELHTHEPPGIDDARQRLCGVVQEVRTQLGEDAPLVMGGFSQGAMLSMDASLRGDIIPPELLFQFSGTVICQNEWTSALDRLSDAFVVQSHGRIDPIRPFPSAVRLSELL